MVTHVEDATGNDHFGDGIIVHKCPGWNADHRAAVVAVGDHDDSVGTTTDAGKMGQTIGNREGKAFAGLVSAAIALVLGIIVGDRGIRFSTEAGLPVLTFVIFPAVIE